MADPAETAAVALFLASDESSFMGKDRYEVSVAGCWRRHLALRKPRLRR
jgi:hypothetical protein